MKKRIITVIFSIVFSFGLFGQLVYADTDAVDDGDISAGSWEYDVNAGELHRVRFIAPANGVLEVNSSGNTVIYGYLYDADGNTLVSDEDTLDDYNFSYSYIVKSGTVYYIGFRFLNPDSSGTIPVNVSFTERTDGWHFNDDGRVYYVRDGEILTGWQEIDGEVYYFDDKGFMHRDSVVYIYDPDTDTRYAYCFDKDGHMVVGWYEDLWSNHYYYLEDGKAADGLLTVDGVLHYFCYDGKMYCDMAIIDEGSNRFIFIDEAGTAEMANEVQEGWNDVCGYKYYIENGSPVSGWKIIDEKTYCFRYDGRMYAGILAFVYNGDHGSDRYYFDENGQYVTGWFPYGGDMYYFGSDGKGAKYLNTINGKSYYFDNGRMRVNEIIYDHWSGRMIAVGPDGVVVHTPLREDGWNQVGDKWFYLKNKEPVQGLMTIDRKQYYFYSNGEMAANTTITDDQTGRIYVVGSDGVIKRDSGWHQDSSGKWYYVLNNTDVAGWQQISGKWYYFSQAGRMLTGWQKIKGSWYYLKSSGAMAVGWEKIGGTWYYFRSSGVMAAGWQKIGSTWYCFKSSGAMAAGEWCGGYWLNSNGSWTYQPKGSWKKDSTGWWFGDTSGWYAKNSTVKIDNVSYKFNSAGYWVK